MTAKNTPVADDEQEPSLMAEVSKAIKTPRARKSAKAPQVTTEQVLPAGQQLLSLLTIGLAFVFNNQALMMTPDETKAIGTPLLNILSKSGMGGAVFNGLANSQDFVALGWGLFLYVGRVAEATPRKEKQQHESSTGSTPHAAGDAEAIPVVATAIPSGWRSA